MLAPSFFINKMAVSCYTSSQNCSFNRATKAHIVYFRYITGVNRKFTQPAQNFKNRTRMKGNQILHKNLTDGNSDYKIFSEPQSKSQQPYQRRGKQNDWLIFALERGHGPASAAELSVSTRRSGCGGPLRQHKRLGAAVAAFAIAGLLAAYVFPAGATNRCMQLLHGKKKWQQPYQTTNLA